MANKPRIKMSIQERAKQFMPFSPLRGLNQALWKKEKEYIPKPELSETEAQILNSKLSVLKRDMDISLAYYSNGECKDITGTITLLNTDLFYLEIDDVRIDFNDILDIKL